jgi:predicted ferric reductase
VDGHNRRALPSVAPPAARSTRDAIYVIFAANLVTVAALWWISSGFEVTHSASDAFNGLGRITGLLGTDLALAGLVLMARIPWLEDGLGFEHMAGLHRWNGYAVVALLVAHGVFQTVGYQLGDGKDVLGQLLDFVNNYPGLLGAIVGLGLFVAVALASITTARRHMAYETWYFVHLYSYLGIALAFSHQVATGVDFINNPAFVLYWYLLYVVTVGSLVLYRVVRPLAAFRRHRFRVQSVQKEARGVFSVYIAGRDLASFPAQAGQFAIWRFLDRSRWWQAHPFSISAVPDGRRLRVTVKNIGDFTRGVHLLRPGTPVLVEGPFGKFTERSAGVKALMIAGGIGITPIRPLAEELAGDGYDVRVIYRAHTAGDLVFKDELDGLATRLGVQVDYLLTEDGRKRSPRNGWFRPEQLLRQVPDIKERDVYLCGPPAMAAAVRTTLDEVGMPSGQIRTEVFRF